MTRSISRTLRVLYLSGSRADYTPMRPVFRALAPARGIDLGFVVTGMHLEPRFGRTERLIAADGYRIEARVRATARGDGGADMAAALAATLAGTTTALARLRPDALFVHGDRDEALAGAIAAGHLGIPLIHLGGGDVSGSIDDTLKVWDADPAK